MRGENMINGKGIRVLFVEDSEDDMLLLKRMLSKSGEEISSIRVETAADFERELTSGKWDITIVDFKLPSFDGREALKIFKRSGIDIPFILVSGTIGEELAVEMMKLGASDYIMKNNLPRLVPAVKKELEDAEERRKHRATLARVHMLAEIVESAEVGVISIDADAVVKSINTGAEKILGVSAPSLIGKKISIIKNPQGASCFDSLLLKFKEGQKISGKELCVKSEKIGAVFILTTFSHVINSLGEIVGTSIIFHDITLQRKAEAELHDTQRWMMETLNSLKTGVVLINPATRCILGANDAAVSMLGLSQGDVVGKKCVGLLCDATEKCPIDNEQTPENHFESVLSRKNLPVLKNVQKTTLSGKEVLVESFIDISELKHAQAEKEKIEKQIQEADRLHALGLMAGAIAHDFKNFLQILIVNLELMSDPSNDKDEFEKIIQDSRKVVSNAVALCSQLTSFAGGKPPSLERNDLVEIVRQSASILIDTAKPNVQIKMDTPKEKLEILADPVQISQIVNNIMLNAIQAIGEKNGSVFVSVGEKRIQPNELLDILNKNPLKEGRYAFVSIEDTGCGMDEETKSKIFDPFFSTKSKGIARGLGLAMIPNVIHCHRGGITVESAQGIGSKFVVYLPLLA